jgi:hypothetical protein
VTYKDEREKKREGKGASSSSEDVFARGYVSPPANKNSIMLFRIRYVLCYCSSSIPYGQSLGSRLLVLCSQMRRIVLSASSRLLKCHMLRRFDLMSCYFYSFILLSPSSMLFSSRRGVGGKVGQVKKACRVHGVVLSPVLGIWQTGNNTKPIPREDSYA